MGVFSFVFGVAAGAAAGVLLAPKPGAELRNELMQADFLETQKAKLGEAMEAGVEEAGAKTEEIKAKIEEARSRLRDQLGSS